MKRKADHRIREARQDQILKTVAYLLCSVWLVLILMPLVMIVSNSMKDTTQCTAQPPAWLPRPTLGVTIQLNYDRVAKTVTPARLQEMVKCDLAAANLITVDRFNRDGVGKCWAEAYLGDKRIGEVSGTIFSGVHKAQFLPATTISQEYLRKKDRYKLYYSSLQPNTRFDFAGSLGNRSYPGNQSDSRSVEVANWMKDEPFYGQLISVGGHPYWWGYVERWITPYLTPFYGSYPPFYVFIANSLLVTVVEIVLSLLLSAMAAYALSRLFRRTASRFWLLYFLISMMIPAIGSLVPAVFLAKDLGIFDSMWGIILFFIPSAFMIYLLKGFTDALPGELFDGARIDGASEYNVFWRIVLPLSKSALAVGVMLLFLASWNDFFWPYIIMKTPDKFTFPIALYFFTANMSARDASASAVFGISAAIPTLLVFALFQDQIREGMVWSGIKG